MSDRIDSCLPLPLDQKTLQDVVEKAKDYLLMHGICMRRRDAYDRDALHFAPFLLLPSAFPRAEFERSVELQPLLNELMHKVAHDDDFLRQSLTKTIAVDEFTGKLFQIYETVQQEGISQPLSLGLFRCDYFYCCQRGSCLQVEFNTVASSFGGISSQLCLAHKYILSELGRLDMLKNIPDNKALEGLSGAMLKAWKLYNQPKAIILFIIEDVTYNICDQRFHEFEIRRQNPEVFVVRKTLTQVADEGYLDNEKRLFVDGQEVAVIYFRCGYHPDQYPGEKEWDARLMMERSLAIKSPSIQYHLAGTKKVQQELAKPGMVEKFFDDPKKVAAIRRIFTGLYSLDEGPEGNAAFELALQHPDRYVVKPQREGGGNNIYGENIRPFLEGIQNSKERNAYILMEMIKPPISTNYMVRPGSDTVNTVECVSELGIFGAIIGTKSEVLDNKYLGHMLRTKLSHVNEGGVAAGLGALDSVYLVDVDHCCDV